jgi:hypothetical protein
MNNPIQRALLGCAAAALAGCYAQVESSLTVTRDVPVCDDGASSCVFSGVTSSSSEVMDVLKVGAQSTFTLSTDQSFIASEEKAGPVTLKSKVLLNSAVLTMGDGYASDFGGVEELRIIQLSGGSGEAVGLGCQLPAGAAEIGRYQRPADTGSAIKAITVVGEGVNILERLDDAKQLTLSICGKGALPTTSWAGSLALDISVESRGQL